MNYPVVTSIQLRAVLRAMRKSRALSQEKVGQLLGVNQKRVARIESTPGVAGFDQIARLVSVLGGRLVIEAADPTPGPTGTTNKRKSRKATPTVAGKRGHW
ncbi:MAG: helix-turn-helix domain-containing protein [Opitutaceae bacterium]|nr:helix-turn-helix domain-containing protein [Opitutaceae bacterium]